MMDDHCTAKEKETIESKKAEEKLISAYNVLRIHQFLGKYESDLNHRRSRNAKDKKPRLSKEQREERDAAISHLVARMHPEPPTTEKRAMSVEEKSRMKSQRKKVRNKKRPTSLTIHPVYPFSRAGLLVSSLVLTRALPFRDWRCLCACSDSGAPACPPACL